MNHSMTAFASKTLQDEWGQIVCELKSVNSRYLEFTFRLPEAVRHLELRFRDIIRKKLHRGKVECSIKLKLTEAQSGQLSLNTALVEQLSVIARQLDDMVIPGRQLSASDYLQWPGVVNAEEMDLSRLEEDMMKLLAAAVDELLEVRAREGKQLALIILERVKNIKNQIDTVKALLPEALSWQQAKIKERFNEAGIEYDKERLELELVLLAQKIDVAEELDRLGTHLDEVARVLTIDGQVGRRLDFLMQELNREANTLASKSINADITAAAIEIKVLIEQIREQIQNLE